MSLYTLLFYVGELFLIFVAFFSVVYLLYLICDYFNININKFIFWIKRKKSYSCHSFCLTCKFYNECSGDH